MTLFSAKPAFIFFAFILMNVLKADKEGLVSKLDCVRDTGKLKGADEDIISEKIQPKEDVFYDMPEQFFHDPTWRQIETTDESTQENPISTVNKILRYSLGESAYNKFTRKMEQETGPYIKERPKKFNQRGGQLRSPFSKPGITRPKDLQYVNIKARTNKRESHLLNQPEDFKKNEKDHQDFVFKYLTSTVEETEDDHQDLVDHLTSTVEETKDDQQNLVDYLTPTKVETKADHQN